MGCVRPAPPAKTAARPNAPRHFEVGARSGDHGSERLEVVPDENEKHPRIHQHPYGRVNDVRVAANLYEPIGWLSALNALVHGALDDDSEGWDNLAGEGD